MNEKSKSSGWGKGITYFYSGFVVFILSLVIFASSQNFDLVERNYYQKEIDYQTKIDQMNNVKELKQKPYWAFDDLNKNFVLFFPTDLIGEDFNGEIHFFRPSDQAHDFIVPLNFSEQTNLAVSFQDKLTEKWKVKISWTNNDVHYYMEDLLIIN